jgi:hypothetical protein
MVMALEGTMVGLLSRAAHSHICHDNSRHFRGNYQRVSLNNQFPSVTGDFPTRKSKKEEDWQCHWAGDNTPLRSGPFTITFKFH